MFSLYYFREKKLITILAGGTGSVKLVRGFASQRSDVNVITNVGDDYWLYGLYICPDIDTIIYGLSDLLGEDTWFRIGDRDTATHLTRTNMLKNGKSISQITKWMCEKFAIEPKIIPVTDNTVSTRITTNKGKLHLQEYWVKYRGMDPVEGIEYEGIEKARPNPDAISAIHDSELVIIAPGNPLTSIGPMMMMKGIKKELYKNKRKVVAVSPIIGDKAVSGPAGKYMEAAGLEVSAYGVAKWYAEVCSKIVIDTRDRIQTKKIESLNLSVYDTKIKMLNKKDEDALASFLLKQIRV